MRTVEDIAKELCTLDALTSDEQEEEDCGSSHHGPPTTAETHLALDFLRRAVAGESICETTCAHFYAFEKEIVEDLSEKEKRSRTSEAFFQANIFFFILCTF